MIEVGLIIAITAVVGLIGGLVFIKNKNKQEQDELNQIITRQENQLKAQVDKRNAEVEYFGNIIKQADTKINEAEDKIRGLEIANEMLGKVNMQLDENLNRTTNNLSQVAEQNAALTEENGELRAFKEKMTVDESVEVERINGLIEQEQILKNAAKKLHEDNAALDKELREKREMLERSRQLVEENAVQNRELEEKKAAIERALKLIEDYDGEVMTHHKECLVRCYGESNGKYGVLGFDEREIAELTELKRVLGFLSNPMPLNKVIYEMYYRDKLKSMMANLGVGSRVCGIYRLYVVGEDGAETSYVGQSVDISNRWYQHLKRFVGSEPATGIKLYKSRIDLSKLRWEIIEEVDQSRLNEREKYWIEFYNCIGGWNSRG